MFDLVTFSDEIDLNELNQTQFLPIKLRCFSDGLTKHGYLFTLDSIKEAAFTLNGKPLLWKYDFFADDAAGHETDEVPCGFIPENAKASYVYDKEYDKTFVEIDAYLWVKYAEKLVEIFKRTDGVKDVSVELLLYQSSVDADDLNITICEKYCFAGVTILGEAVTPAVEGATATVLSFADEQSEFECAKQAFEKQLNNSYQKEPVNGSFSLSEKNKWGGENTMNEEKIENSVNTEQEQVDNAMVVDTIEVKVKENTDAYLDNGDAIYTETEQKKRVTVITEVPDEAIIGGGEATVENATSEELDNATSEELDNACGDGEKVDDACGDKVDNADVKCAELEKKCTEIQNSYNELKAQYDALCVKCSELEEYKANIEKTEYSAAVECALSDVAEYISEAERDEWRAKSVNCSSISEFTNQLKAFAFDRRAKETSNGISRSPLVAVVEQEGNGIWDKMGRAYR